jgi:hypothetical protein
MQFYKNVLQGSVHVTNECDDDEDDDDYDNNDDDDNNNILGPVTSYTSSVSVIFLPFLFD